MIIFLVVIISRWFSFRECITVFLLLWAYFIVLFSAMISVFEKITALVLLVLFAARAMYCYVSRVVVAGLLFAKPLKPFP